jgi:hypothetical protein
MATVFSTLNAVQTRRPSMVQEHSGRAAGVAGAIVFHLLLLAALFTYAPARQTLSHVTPIVVSLIAETRPAPLPSRRHRRRRSGINRCPRPSSGSSNRRRS